MSKRIQIDLPIPDRQDPAFGKWLQAWRKGHKITQGRLAETAGLSWLTIARWEEGVRRPHRLAYAVIVTAIEDIERKAVIKQRKADWNATRKNRDLSTVS